MTLDETAKPQLALPGLELTAPYGQDSELRRSVVATLKALDKLGLLEERHAADAQLCLTMAEVVETGKRSRHAGSTAQAARTFIDAMARLPVPAAADANAEWDAMVRALIAGNSPAPSP